jgi:hypothetical protein
MDDEKENGEKSITERISDTVKNIVDATSEATMNAFKTEEPKPGPAKETREQVYVPEATDAVAAPAPLVPADPIEPAPRVKKGAAHKRAKKKRVTKAEKAAPPKTAPKNSAKKSAKKAAPKKTAKKASKKAAKKSKKTKKTKRGR